MFWSETTITLWAFSWSWELTVSMCHVQQILTDQRTGGVMLAQTRRPDIVLQMESDNPTDRVFTGREVIPLDDSRVSAQNAIYKTPASIKARPAGRSPMPFLKCFCQVCRADSCLIAAHHCWGPLQEERNQCPPCFNPRQNKAFSPCTPFCLCVTKISIGKSKKKTKHWIVQKTS